MNIQQQYRKSFSGYFDRLRDARVDIYIIFTTYLSKSYWLIIIISNNMIHLFPFEM